MNLLGRFGNWIASLGGAERVDVPVGGRSSVEKTGLSYSLTNFSERFSGVSPVISREMLKVLKQLWLYHPEFSQGVGNLVSLGNTGHQLTVSSANPASAERAVARLNETAARIFQHGAGVDGLINQELTTVAWSGALSSEDVVNLIARRVDKVVLVPVEDIHFKYEDDRWTPYQHVGIARAKNTNGLIPLHPETYRYYAVETIDNSPYAKPPATAAVQAITELQNEVVENVKYIVKKFSILGLLSVMVRRLTKRNTESEGEFDNRQKTYLKDVRDSLSGSFGRGLLVAYDNMQFKGENVSANGTGFYEVYRVIAEMMMSGLRQQPAFFGRTDSTTETYADVVYQLLLAQAHNYQRIVKRRRERTYMFDLRLGGFEVDGVSMRFNKAFSRNLLAEAQAKQTEIANALDKAKAGIISPNAAAQELGYDSAYDPTLLEENSSLAATLASLHKRVGAKGNAKSLLLSFNQESQKYEFVSPTIHLGSSVETDEQTTPNENGNVVPIKKKQSA